MRPLALLFLAFVAPCVADISVVDAALRLYAFFVYDLEVEVWGPGRGSIATHCVGTVKANRACTFNEFINYIETGKSDTAPQYYDVKDGVRLSPGDFIAIVTAIRKLRDSEDFAPRIIPGRTKAHGMLGDLGMLGERANKRAADQKQNIDNKRENAKQALNGLQDTLRASREGSLAAKLENLRPDATWKTKEGSSSFVKGKWKAMDWPATVAANSGLRDRRSPLFRTTNKIITDHVYDAPNRRESAMADTAYMMSGCL